MQRLSAPNFEDANLIPRVKGFSRARKREDPNNEVDLMQICRICSENVARYRAESELKSRLVCVRKTAVKWDKTCIKNRMCHF